MSRLATRLTWPWLSSVPASVPMMEPPLGADRDGDAPWRHGCRPGGCCPGRVQAHRGVAIGRHHAVDRLHRQRAGQVDGEIARIAHVAHQRARLQLLRAGAVLRHEWHVDGLPDRVQEGAADVHHLQAGGPGRGDVRLQLLPAVRRSRLPASGLLTKTSLFSNRPKRSANRNCSSVPAASLAPSCSAASFENMGLTARHRLASVKSTWARSSETVPAGPT